MRKMFLILYILILGGILQGSVGAGSIGGGSIRSHNGGAAGFATLGGAVPTFHLALDGSGVSELPQTITYNGSTLTPDYRYEGQDATASAWTAVVGQDLTVTTGTDNTVNSPAPFHDGTQAVEGGGVGSEAYYDTTNIGLGTNDAIWEFYVRFADKPTYVGGYVIEINDDVGGSSDSGLAVFSNVTQFGVRVYTDTASTPCIMLVVPDQREWNHYTVYWDYSAVANGCRLYQNGVLVAGSTGGSGTAPMTKSRLSLAGYENSTSNALTSDQAIAYAARYSCAGCVDSTDTTAMADFALERTMRIAGVYPDIAKGDPLASVMTRASSATLVVHDATNDVHRLFTVGDNYPRVASWDAAGWGADPSTSATSVVGYWSEASSTSNLTYSEQADHANWTKSVCTISADAIAAPDGSTTADGIIADSGGDTEHKISQVGSGGTYTSGNKATVSAFAKVGELNYAALAIGTCANAPIPYYFFDVANCALASQGQGDATAARADDMGNGWCRISMTADVDVTTNCVAYFYPIETDLDYSYSGDGSGVDTYFWGMQLEQQSVESSYIKTTTAAVTRSADAFNFSVTDNYDTAGGKGTIVIGLLAPNHDFTGTGWYLSGISDGSSSDHIMHYIDNGGDVARQYVRAASVNELVTNGSTTDIVSGAYHVTRSTWDTDEGKVFVDGAQEGSTDTTGDPPTSALTEINVIHDYYAGNPGSPYMLGPFKIYNNPYDPGEAGTGDDT